MKKRVRSTGIMLLTAVSLLSFFLAGCGAETGEKTEAAEGPRFVRYIKVRRTDAGITRQFSGITASDEELVMAFRIAGKVDEVAVKAGDRVKSGQLLLSLDDDELILEKRRAEASLESARVQAETAAASYRRTRELYQNDSASRTQLETSRSAAEAAESSLVAATAQLEGVNLKLSYTRLYAPFSGEITQVLVERGTVVGAGQVVTGLTGNTVNIVRFSVAEDIVSRISTEMKASVSVPAAGLSSIPAEVTEVSSGVQSGSLFPVKIRLQSPETGTLRPNMACTIHLEIPGESGELFHVPSHAVLEDEKGVYVFTAIPGPDESTGTVEKLYVTPGNLSDKGLAVTGGLTEGEIVITAGMTRLSENMTVRLGGEEN